MPCAFADPAFMQAMFREFQGLSGQHNCRGAARFGSGGCDVASPFATFLNGQRIEKYETDESYFIFVRTGAFASCAAFLRYKRSTGWLCLSALAIPTKLAFRYMRLGQLYLLHTCSRSLPSFALCAPAIRGLCVHAA